MAGVCLVRDVVHSGCALPPAHGRSGLVRPHAARPRRRLAGSVAAVSSALLAALAVGTASATPPDDPQPPVVVQSAFLKAASARAGARFGKAVAMSGDTAVVGAPCDSSPARGVNGDPSQTGAPCAGAVSVFVRQGETWVLQAYLKASNADAGDAFGESVAISGDTIVVGAPREDSAATSVNGDASDNSAPDAGAAYVFVRRGSAWTQEAYLKGAYTAGAGLHGQDPKQLFGTSVAISGDTIAIGAQGTLMGRAMYALRAGSLYVFGRSSAGWVQQVHLHAEQRLAFNPTRTDYGINGTHPAFLHLGRALALSGDTLAVSGMVPAARLPQCVGGRASRHPDGEDAVFLFVRSGTTWREEACLVRDVPPATGSEPLARRYPEPSDLPPALVWYDDFGAALALEGDTLLVGAPLEVAATVPVPHGAPGIGGVGYVFRRGTSSWTKEARLLAPPDWNAERLGLAVALQGNTAVLGTSVNAATVFTREATVWTPVQRLHPDAGDTTDGFGTAVALSGAGALIGAPDEDSDATGVDGDQANNRALNAGAAYVFRPLPMGFTPGALTRGAAGGAVTVVYTAIAQDTTWTVSGLPPWLSVTPASGRGSAVLTLGIAAQAPGAAARTATVTVGTATLSVTQASAPTVTLDGMGDWLAPSTGGTTTVSLRAAAGTPWTVSSGAPWLTVTPATGTGSAVLTLQIASQAYDAPARSTSLAVGPQSMVVRQLRAQVPDPPSHLRATLAGSQLTLSWDAPTAPVDLSHLLIEYGLAPGQRLGVITTPATTRERTVTAPPGRYFIRLRSANSLGLSAPSAELEVRVGQPASPPGRPHDLSAAVNGQRVALSWQRPADSQRVTGYVVEAGPADAAAVTGALPVGLNSTYAVDDVPPGLYRVRVRAVNDEGVGEPSEDLLVAVGDVPPPPGRPSALAVFHQPPHVTLRWSAPASGGPPLGYILEVGSREGLADLGQLPMTGTSFAFRNDAVPPGQYWIQVRAIGTSGPGLPSNALTLRIER